MGSCPRIGRRCNTKAVGERRDRRPGPIL